MNQIQIRKRDTMDEDRPMTRDEIGAMWGKVYKAERDRYRAALEAIMRAPLASTSIARKALGDAAAQAALDGRSREVA